MNALLTAAGGALLMLLSSSCAGTIGEECGKAPFQGKREIAEAGSVEESQDPCWWLSSGGMFYTDDGIAHTIIGASPPGSEWREKYAKNSARDTDNGERPQNLLRLVTRDDNLKDYRQEVRFRIKNVNMTDSPERGSWSGVLMFQRYQDQDNLYYTGLRVDGTAIIKKKVSGKYVTLAQQPVFGQPDWYNRATNPSLLPLDRWLIMTSELRTQPDGTVLIRLQVRDETQQNQGVVEAVDDGREGGAQIKSAGRAGLRGDFMDVEFASYALTPLGPEENKPVSRSEP